jgi:hypothetical protein
MNKPTLITNYNDFDKHYSILESEDTDLDMDTSVLSKLVDLVGDEQDIEDCAREAFEDLEKSFERDELKMEEGDQPEKLVMSALIVKLVEKGKLGPQEADEFIDENL